MTATISDIRYPLAIPSIANHHDIVMAAEAGRLLRNTPRSVVLGYPDDVRADWNLAAMLPGPFHAELTRTLTAASRANRYSPIARRVVGVSGPTRSAKTMSTLLCLLDICGPIILDNAPRQNRAGALMDPIPIVWVSPKDSGVKGLVRAMAEFFGLREPLSRSTAEILKDLHRACIDHGTLYVVIDDLHGLRTGATGETITLLREVIAALPATVVLTGIDIHDERNSALWGKGTRRHDAQQVRGRISWLDTTPQLTDSRTTRATGETWTLYFRPTMQSLYLAHPVPADEQTHIALTLFDVTRALYGAGLDLLTEAASEATLRGEPLTADLIREISDERARA